MPDPTCKDCRRWVRCEIETYEGHCHDAAPKLFLDRHGRFVTGRPVTNADDVACRTGFVLRRREDDGPSLAQIMATIPGAGR